MSVLSKAVELYKEVCANYAKTSPTYMQLRQFITGNFGHDGTRAMAEADGEQLPAQRTSTLPAKRLQAFKHPNAKTAPKPQSNASQLPGEADGLLNSQESEADAVEVNEAEVDGLPTDPANVEITEVNEAAIKDLKANAVTGKYNYESLRAYVAGKGHNLTGAESHKQLGAIAVHLAKQA